MPLDGSAIKIQSVDYVYHARRSCFAEMTACRYRRKVCGVGSNRGFDGTVSSDNREKLCLLNYNVTCFIVY